jgi:hypothetical protein
MPLFRPTDSIAIPRRLIHSKSNNWNLAGGSMSPGQTVSGAFPYATLPGCGLWVAATGSVYLRTPDDARAYRAIRNLAKQGVMPLIVPRIDAFSIMPFPLDGNGKQITAYDTVPFSDGSSFSDGTRWRQSVIDCALVNSATINATQLTMRFVNGGPLRGGESFSLFHDNQGWRCYEVAGVDLNDDGDSVVTITPWLRDDIDAGSYVDFDEPKCTMRIADPKAMDFRMETFPFAPQDASFVEYFFKQPG